jgi:uncharacterized protein YecE (DUF72 family)
MAGNIVVGTASWSGPGFVERWAKETPEHFTFDAQAETVRVMFNNNRADDAPRAALRMRELLGQSGAPATRAAA